MEQTYRIGTRKSPLALRQVVEVTSYLRKFYPSLMTEAVSIDTYGDKDKTTPISEIEGSDFFTREIEEALLRGEIDFAVHSAKDLPDRIPDGLYIAAITKSIDPYDCLVSKNNLKLWQLPYGAKLGASSQRRKTQLKAYRDDFKVVDIRGNIQERIEKLEEPDLHHPLAQGLGLDAIIVAGCALLRLGLEHRITEKIPFDILKPHPLQGCLAIETKKEDLEIIRLVSSIDTRQGVAV